MEHREAPAGRLGDPDRPGRITVLLRKWSRGDRSALDELVPLVDAELRRLARHRLRHERPNPSVDRTTALVNETYLRLLRPQSFTWQDRAHFIGIAARLMRQILVDHARRDQARKRGGAAAPAPLGDDPAGHAVPGRLERVDLIALHQGLERLAELDPRQARVVELRFFGGLTLKEAAEVLRVSVDTVKRDWRNSRLWLRRELLAGGAEGGS